MVAVDLSRTVTGKDPRQTDWAGPVPLPIPPSMRGEDHFQFEHFLHDLALLGVVAFGIWVVAGAMGWAAGFATITPDQAIRFMAAVLVLMIPSVVYPDLKAWRYRAMSPEERFGFAREH